MDQNLAAQLELDGLSNEEYVDLLYRLALRRPPEEAARSRAVSSLAAGTLSRATLLAELVDAAEFARVRALDDAVAFAAWARAAGERPRELRAPVGDERPIEIPWALGRLRQENRLLDVGTTFAEPAYVSALLALGRPGLVGLDLAPGEIPGLRLVRGDVRALPFPDESFDAAICISTLEHVGADTSAYGVDQERDAGGMERALRELRRVLARNGRLLVTVPTGAAEDHGSFVQLPPDEWLSLFRRADFLVFEREIYALGADGWQQASPDEVAGRRYGDPGPAAAAILCVELRPRALGETIREKARAIKRNLFTRRARWGSTRRA